MGDRCAHIEAAVGQLRSATGVVSVALSSLYETEPVGGPPGQGRYLNAAACVETTLEPEAFLELLMVIERELGRVRRERWGPRIIDLDLLLFDDRVIDSPGLTVPHPRMHERRFVLEPLAEIGGAVIDPRSGRTISEILMSLP